VLPHNVTAASLNWTTFYRENYPEGVQQHTLHTTGSRC
jgi:hypothetical protein